MDRSFAIELNYIFYLASISLILSLILYTVKELSFPDTLTSDEISCTTFPLIFLKLCRILLLYITTCTTYIATRIFFRYRITYIATRVTCVCRITCCYQNHLFRYHNHLVSLQFHLYLNHYIYET